MREERRGWGEADGGAGEYLGREGEGRRAEGTEGGEVWTHMVS